MDGSWTALGQLDKNFVHIMVLINHIEVYSSILFGGLDRLPIIKSTLSMRETFESAAAAKF